MLIFLFKLIIAFLIAFNIFIMQARFKIRYRAYKKLDWTYIDIPYRCWMVIKHLILPSIVDLLFGYRFFFKGKKK